MTDNEEMERAREASRQDAERVAKNESVWELLERPDDSERLTREEATQRFAHTTLPVLTKREGPIGWLAATPPDCPLRFAVVAETEGAATKLFYERLTVWEGMEGDA